MKILSAEQIREADQYTIKNEPIASIDLMERAVNEWVHAYLQSDIYEYQKPVVVLCGPGNNGGDGLGIARILRHDHPVSVYLLTSATYSEDNLINQKRAIEHGLELKIIKNAKDITIPDGAIVIDALFGSGLSRPLNGLPADVVRSIKELPNKKIAVDIPSGMFADDNDANNPDTILPVDMTITFQSPKLAFLMMPTGPLTGELKVVNIGLHPDFMRDVHTKHILLTQSEIAALYSPRHPWIHKGQAGKGLLIGGVGHTTGAVILSSLAALRSGIGLLYVACGSRAVSALPIARPEAIVFDLNDLNINELISTIEPDALAVGPGLGTSQASAELLDQVLEFDIPMVLDADALNLIAMHKWQNRISTHHLLTPHPGEAARLFGSGKVMEFHHRLSDFVQASGCVLVYKGKYSRVYAPDGKVFFNTTGNAGMATAGSGDVLTGILLALLAANYSTDMAARLGVYIHGYAGDLALDAVKAGEAVIASDIPNHIGQAFAQISAVNL